MFWNWDDIKLNGFRGWTRDKFTLQQASLASSFWSFKVEVLAMTVKPESSFSLFAAKWKIGCFRGWCRTDEGLGFWGKLHGCLCGPCLLWQDIVLVVQSALLPLGQKKCFPNTPSFLSKMSAVAVWERPWHISNRFLTAVTKERRLDFKACGWSHNSP